MEKLAEEIRQIAKNYSRDKTIAAQFFKRIEEGGLTRDENPNSHFCVYFAAYDPVIKRVFLGHHIKSGLWLFNGGHIDQRETLKDALDREMEEEWGTVVPVQNTVNVSLLTITPIPEHQKLVCKTHYDIWYFVPVDSNTIQFDQQLLKKEFHQAGWFSAQESMQLATDPATIQALTLFNHTFWARMP